MLTIACDEAVGGTVKGAIANLVAALESPVSSWVVAEHYPDLFIPGRQLIVGDCTFSMYVPGKVAGKDSREFLLDHDFKPPIGYVTVQARGQTSAQILGGERLMEGAAILDLISPPKLTSGRRTLVRNDEGASNLLMSRGGWMIHGDVVTKTGRLAERYGFLSSAARRSEDRRTDWARRTLAATRWLSVAGRSHWPAERLVNVMSALECLFIGPDKAERHNKGARIAERFTDHFQMHERDIAEQREWLCDLYQRRNDSAHEGREYFSDLAVDRLLELTRHAIQVAAGHLIPSHRETGGACKSWDEAIVCGYWYAGPREP